MTEQEIDKPNQKIDEVWGDWVKVFDIMIANDFHIEADNICNENGDTIFEDVTSEVYREDVVDLIYDYFHLYKSTKKPKVSEAPKQKSKYMKLC